MLVPLNDRSQPLPADNAINGSEQEECHGSCR
jgi:hypothetical protein